MLIKVTNRCSMGCSHCMEDSTVAGQHMTWETFKETLEFTRRIEGPGWGRGVYPLVSLSGGECTEHPEIVRYVEEALKQGYFTVLISNGMWLKDPKLKSQILRKSWDKLRIQVTNDPRFYPSKPPRHNDSRIVYVDALTLLVPLGRLGRKAGPHPLPMKTSPSSFNLRSLTRRLNSFAAAVQYLRMLAMTRPQGRCTPNITEDGVVHAGETRHCLAIGTVRSSDDELTNAIWETRCNKCGLVDNLTPEQKLAIGEM